LKEPLTRSIAFEHPFDVARTLAPLSRGRFDPTFKIIDQHVYRASRTPDGPGTQQVWQGDGTAYMQAWGPGAGWLIERMPPLIGASDDPGALEPLDTLVEQMKKALPWLRLGRTDAVFEAALPSIIEQKVTGKEARGSFARLAKMLAEPAPGPFGLTLPPHPKVVAQMPYHHFHPIGIERKRADTIMRAASVASQIEQTTNMTFDDAYKHLLSVRGIGRWTAAEVGRVAYGDPDAVSVGDYHLKNVVCFAFTGRPRGTDEQMLELLEPYRGQRGRVIRMIELTCARPPRYGPRMPVTSFASL
jgi:3-methyladenine DNA glycosylase/8-oxoguanine DNA glycosylase